MPLYVFISISFMPYNLSFAGDILPVFSGNYTNAYLKQNKYYKKIKLEEIKNEPSCFLNEYIDKSKDYHLKVPGDIENLTSYSKSIDPAPIFEGNPTHYTKCVFSKIEQGEPWYFFEYPGSWQEAYISLDKTPIFYAHYTCYENDPDSFPDEEDQVIQLVPIYECPKGYTSLGVYQGCIKNEKLICPGDVLGRDLDVNKRLPDFIRQQGHVGISIFKPSKFNDGTENIYDPIKIAEMDAEQKANKLVISTIDDFKNTVKNGYWGAKYGTDKQPNNMTISQYLGIKKLLNFILKEDVKYTLYWNYYIRHTVKSYLYNPYSPKPTTVDWTYPSTFRCDTLVKYLYENGAKIQLELSPLFTPKDLFRSLIGERDNTYIKYLNNNEPKTDECSGDLIDIENKINEKLQPKSFSELYQLDACMRQLKKVPGDEKQKVTYLWSLYEKAKKEKNHFQIDYVIDALSDYKTLDLTRQIIKEMVHYNSKFLDLLIENIRFDTQEEIYKLSSSDIENINLIYDFFNFTEDNFPKNEKNFNKKLKAEIKTRLKPAIQSNRKAY
ncbi:hypothetical protein LDG_7063 [Legionella drancourtii LLAP12]|uniref:Uncharacterized protein n=1 Tax=Legionella drancourtii LLAP12 TaxID=658187 RepID=G9EP80_9GAMM|nr:hypothetical protein LDG_7063 [Legionella drancourtii LLAP12]